MFDSHCHLNSGVFENNLDETVREAREAGVKRILIPGWDLSSSLKAATIAEQYNNMYSAVGIHPNTNIHGEHIDSLVAKVEEMAEENSLVVAIGEIGLDYYKANDVARIQKLLLEKQIQLAAKLGLAVVLHCRHAGSDLVNILEQNWSDALPGRIVFHSCEEDEILLEFAKKRNIFIGVAGDITYNRSKVRFIKRVPFELLVAETDSPYQTPHPARDTNKYPNTPRNLPSILEKLANIINSTQSEVAKITESNSRRLFELDK